MKHLLLVILLVQWSLALTAQDFDYSIAHIVLNESNYTRDFYITDQQKTWRVDDGKSYHWYKSHTVQSTMGGQGGRLLHGSYCEYFLNKSLRTQGAFRKGLKVGEWKHWYSSGTLDKIENYRKGVRHGDTYIYGIDGQVKQRIRFRKGAKHGWAYTWANGKWNKSERYKKGLLVKTQIIEGEGDVMLNDEQEAKNQEEPEEATPTELKEERSRLRELYRKLKMRPSKRKSRHEKDQL